MKLSKLENWSPHKFLEHEILESVPYVFNDDFQAYLKWKSVLSQAIEVDSRSFVIVGSAAIGFSINPTKNFRSFDKQSDIDVAVVSQFYFDVAWRTIRNMGGSLYYAQTPLMQASIDAHSKMLIYWGTIATDKILPILPFKKEWIRAQNTMKNMSTTKERDINFRIYKDFESLRAYQINGIKTAQINLLEKNSVKVSNDDD